MLAIFPLTYLLIMQAVGENRLPSATEVRYSVSYIGKNTD